VLRLRIAWPFPEHVIRDLATRVKAFVVPELNMGQMSREIERVARRPVRGVYHAGGAMIPPEPILQAIQEGVA